VKRRRPAEGPAQFASHLAAVSRRQRHLAQPRSAQHTPTIGVPPPARAEGPAAPALRLYPHYATRDALESGSQSNGAPRDREEAHDEPQGCQP
jgi:hypothetical protein